MLHTLAISNYRSLRELVIPLGKLTVVTGPNGSGKSNLYREIADPRGAPAAMLLRERLRSWRFYDSFRADPDAPARAVHVGTRTPILSNDGRDLAAALQTIRELGDGSALDAAVEDAFPGARLHIESRDDRLAIAFRQHGLLRPLSQAELSDGTLRYLLWIAALLTSRPPALMVLNEPETSLHPDLLPALARLILTASERCQVWVVTHAPAIREALARAGGCQSLVLEKELGETSVAGARLIDRPAWSWPPR